MTPASFHVRDAQIGETAPLSALVLRSKASWGYDDAFMAQCRDELKVDEAKLARQRVRVAVRGDELLGLSSATLDPGRQIVEVEDLFVQPDCFKQGVGRALLDDVIAYAKAKGADALELDADPYAQSVYEALGFDVIGWSPSASVPGRLLPRMRRAL